MQSARLGVYTVYYENGEEYHRLKREVWGANCYYVELDKERPIIVDVGAHIGLATLYFKKLFPKAKILALEPFPESALLFRKNMFENQIEGVELIEAALGENSGEKDFYYDMTKEKWHSTASFFPGAWTGDQKSARMKVKTIALSQILEEYHPDLVKMDIEGAELKIIRQTKDMIDLCPHYLIEFHPIDGKGMGEIIKVFEEKGYRVSVSKDGTVVPWQKVRGLSMIEASR